MKRRKLSLVVAAVAVVGAISTTPGLATPPGAGGDHKVTICHVTGSERNPWVIITVDRAAWDGDGANDHTRHVKGDRQDHELQPGARCGYVPEPDNDGGVGG